MKKLALITASLALLATPVLAQSTTTTGAAPADAKFSTVSKDEMFSSKLKGLNITNQQNETVGEITDLAFKNDKIAAMILSVGGFLGMGERLVVVPFGSLQIAGNRVMLPGGTKDALKALPEFKY
ncbi:MAG: PRC-barrel domain-containing protein, partial [Tardiphaga sp.]